MRHAVSTKRYEIANTDFQSKNEYPCCAYWITAD